MDRGTRATTGAVVQDMTTKQKIAKNNLSLFLFTLIVAALVLVASLTWNSALQELFNRMFPMESKGVTAHVLYAIVVTIAITFMIWIIAKLMDIQHPFEVSTETISSSGGNVLDE